MGRGLPSLSPEPSPPPPPWELSPRGHCPCFIRYGAATSAASFPATFTITSLQNPAWIFMIRRCGLQGYPSTLLQALTTCRATSNSTTSTIFVARGAQAPSHSFLSHALPSVPGWTTISGPLSARGQPLLLLLCNTGGSHAPPKRMIKIWRAHSYPHLSGLPFKCPFLDFLPLLTIWSSVQLW